LYKKNIFLETDSDRERNLNQLIRCRLLYILIRRR